MVSLGNGSVPTAQFGKELCGSSVYLQESLDCTHLSVEEVVGQAEERWEWRRQGRTVSWTSGWTPDTRHETLPQLPHLQGWGC